MRSNEKYSANFTASEIKILEGELKIEYLELLFKNCNVTTEGLQALLEFLSQFRAKKMMIFPIRRKKSNHVKAWISFKFSIKSSRSKELESHSDVDNLDEEFYVNREMISFLNKLRGMRIELDSTYDNAK